MPPRTPPSQPWSRLPALLAFGVTWRVSGASRGGGSWLSWGFGRGDSISAGGAGFRGGAGTSWDAERAGQGTSGTYRYAPDTVLAVGEMGCDLWFCRSGGLAPEVLVCGGRGAELVF